MAAVRATTPIWQDEPYVPGAPLDGDRSCEVCVIGGGVGGIAGAWHLAGHGVRALVVEARDVASGASGRNGGFFLAGAAPMYDGMRDRWGRRRAARIYAATLAAQREMLAAADEAGAPLVVLAAQTHAERFYRRLGFLPAGQPYEVRGVPHRWMARYRPSRQ